MSQEADHNPESFAEQVTSPIGKTRAAAIKDEVPDTIGAYKIDRAMPGIRGGMGTVYRAFNVPSLGGHVAIKVMQDADDTPEALALFEEEARKANLARHPNVVQMLYAGHFVDGPRVRPYYVMEWIDDAVMLTDERLLRKLTIRQCVELFIEVCQTVDHGHQRGVIHGDLKPSNVVVTNWRDNPTIKVLDFGLARAMEGWRAERLPIAGGTPRYMSPELAARQGRDPDARSDVYALGVMLREVLLPDWEAPRHILVNASLRAIISKATLAGSRDASRFENVAQLAKALQCWRSSGLKQAWHEWNLRSFHWPAAAALLLALVIGLCAWVFGVQMTDETKASQAIAKVMPPSAITVRDLSRVRVVELRDECLGPILDEAGLDPAIPRTRAQARLIWAHVISRLADAGVPLIVCDITFCENLTSPHDGQLQEAITKAIGRGTRVVMTTGLWGPDPCVPASKFYNIPNLLSGPATATPEKQFDGLVVPLFVQPPNAAGRPSLAALAAASWYWREGQPEILGCSNSSLIVRYVGPQTQQSFIKFPGETDLLDDRPTGIKTGDRCGVTLIRTLPDSEYSEWTLSARELLKKSNTDISTLGAGRAIFLGDGTSEANDTLSRIGRPKDHGYFVQAAAFQTLTSSRRMVMCSGEQFAAVCAFAALLGIALSWFTLGAAWHVRFGVRIGALVLTALVLIGVTAGFLSILYDQFGWLCHPAMPAFSAACGVGCGLFLPRIRGRLTNFAAV